ncbi:MAG TPA: hypothetical protein PLP62_14110 [Flavobacteriaceae bacterium]|nr:hypothetical protein [Flavobacteriaceae bacterium]HQU66543.1 hypothetical protein [Flavobacteriaceae bacterium]
MFRNSGDASGSAFLRLGHNVPAKKEHVAISGIHGWELAPKFPHKLLDFLVRFASRQNEHKRQWKKAEQKQNPLQSEGVLFI